MTQQDDSFLADWAVHSRFGAVEGTNGVERQAASEADGQQRKWFARLLESHGFTVHRDAIGNQFGLLELVPGAPYVLTGSHMDSQPTAGRFDGAYGVMASAHACFRVADELRADPSRARFNLAVVNWFNEEGSRFKPSMMGSSVFTGKMPLMDALATRDPRGVTVKEALDAIDERGGAVFGEGGPEVASYAEIHVQQGRSMEQDGVTIGLVNATWGAHKFEFRITGEQAHSGSTLMEDRRDALLGAARLIVAARELVDEFEPGILHTACGEINVYPNSPVVVASEVQLLFDLRSPSSEVLDAAYARVMETVERVQREDRVEIEVVAEHSWGQNPYPEAGVELAREVAEELGLTHDRVMTVAGHDSTNMKDRVPAVMLFVPSVDGISHNLKEFTRDEDLLAGVDHLTGVVRRLAEGALVD
ncbi:M20 family metallo-hydrolase [Leucobacter sp.]